MQWTTVALMGALFASRAYSHPYMESNQGEIARPLEVQNTTTPQLFSRFLHHFDTRQSLGRCGESFGGEICADNQCCSSYNYCGTSHECVMIKQR